jgi:hypothetical protein
VEWFIISGCYLKLNIIGFQYPISIRHKAFPVLKLFRHLVNPSFQVCFDKQEQV